MTSYHKIVYKFLFVVSMLFFRIMGLEAKEEMLYQIKHESITFENREGGKVRKITAELFYPTRDHKHIADGKFPLVLFAHGYQQYFSDYPNVWETLIPKGYIFAFITTQQGLTVDIDAYAKDIIFLYRHLCCNDVQSAKVLRGHVRKKSALMGHSTGGGAIYLAQAFLPRVTTIVSMSALGKTSYLPISGSSAIDMVEKITISTLILSGSNDCICPPKIYQTPLYEHFAGTKVSVTIEAGDHCGFSDSKNCPIAESLSCGIFFQGETISEVEQRRLSMELVLPWLDYFLKEKPKAWSTFESVLQNKKLKYNSHIMRLHDRK